MRALLVFALLLAAPARADAPRLGLPLACEFGKTCWVQQYADVDLSPGVMDYACGSETYDGHDGTDIRIRDTSSSVAVIASAAGTVKAVHDGVADRLMRSAADRQAVRDIECGNGVVIAHGDGWETQYCHLRQGSVAVKAGDRLEAGAKLGMVGYSGMAAFAHVHLTVRKDGTAVDPFRPSPDAAPACGARNSLWNSEALPALAYHQGDIIGFGFAPGAVGLPQLEEGKLAQQEPQTEWPALVSYLWAINLLAGDEVTVTLTGPGGITASNSATFDHAKAQYLLFAGKKRPPGGWPPGDYTGRITIGPPGAPRLRQDWHATLR